MIYNHIAMDIEKLKPQKLWTYFNQICKIPHISNHTHALTQYLKKELEHLGYQPEVDKHNNIFVTKPAYVGFEKAPIILLQAHSDMVASKAPTSKHDFLKDPIQTIVKGEWVYANQTTLGADNGIAVAMILAIFADRSLKHGPLEALITSEEEIGMVGIQNFDIKKIHAKYLINLDNEDDQEVSIGCPGNIDVFAEIPFKRETKKNPNSVNLSIEISNGIGGHSGQTIGQKRVNAIQQIFNILLNIQSHIPLSLINVCDAGIAKNNIPPHAAVEINIKKEDTSKVKEILEHEFHTLKLEYHELEKDLNLRCFPSKTKLLPMRIKDSDAIISTLTAVPNGVHTFNWKYNVPETSSNLGLIKTTKNTVQVTFMVRSSYDHAQVRLANRIKALFKVVGGKAKETGFIPGWLPKDNVFADIYEKFYQTIFKKLPKQLLISGGVEPAFILSKRPEMFGISIGPLMQEVHTPKERLNIESTQKIFKVLLKFLPYLNNY